MKEVFETLKYISTYLGTALIGLGLLVKIIYDGYQKYKLGKKTEEVVLKQKYDNITMMKGLEKAVLRKAEYLEKNIKDQFRAVKDISNSFYSEIESYYQKEMNPNNDSYITFAIENTLYDFRETSDRMFKEVIYHNHIAEKNEEDWMKYKDRKMNYIFKEMQKKGKEKFEEEIYKVSYEEIAEKTGHKTYQIYVENISILFNDIRAIAMKCSKEIKELEFAISQIYKENEC